MKESPSDGIRTLRCQQCHEHSLFFFRTPPPFSLSSPLLLPLLHFSINCFCGCWRWGTWSCLVWFLGIKVQRLCTFVSLKGISSGCLSERHGPGPHHVRGDSAPQASIPLKLLASEKGFYCPFFFCLLTFCWVIIRRDRLWNSTMDMKEETEQAQSWKQDSILGRTVDFEL